MISQIHNKGKQTRRHNSFQYCMSDSNNSKMMLIVPAYQQLRHPRSKKMTLEDGYEPGDHDVICGRGKSAFHHPGNRRFRLVIYMYMDRYQRAGTKLDKSLVVISIVDSFRSHSGGFVKRDAKKQGEWIEIGDQLAREKVGHALRDAITARTNEGKQPEGGKFAQSLSVEALMETSPKDLINIEKQLKAGESKTKGKGTTKTKASKFADARTKRRNSANPQKITSCCSIGEKEERGCLQSKSLEQSSDEYSPIRLEDLHRTDLSLLSSCFNSNPPPSPESEGKIMEDSDQRNARIARGTENARFAAFVMDALSDDEEATRPPPPVLRQRSSNQEFFEFLTSALLGVEDDQTKDDTGNSINEPRSTELEHSNFEAV